MDPLLADGVPRAYFLVGETASGKSDVAHQIAVRHGCAILSADSMLVYAGMDVGTATPPPAERGAVPYFGINFHRAGTSSSLWSYVQHARGAIATVAESGVPLIVAGGTGLYCRALLDGFSSELAPAGSREKWKAVLEDAGVKGLCVALEQISPEWLASLDDASNPRRLIRALELAEAGVAPPHDWAARRHTPTVVGLRWGRDALNARIRLRVEQMFEGGLLAEAERLRATGALSDTATQAIGYAEAFAVLDGVLSREEALERTLIRTRRLAKRQRTWFRHQMDVAWVEMGPSLSTDTAADAVENLWREHGPNRLRI